MMMCNGRVSFKVEMQGVTAQSTTEAESGLRGAGNGDEGGCVVPGHDEGAGLQETVQVAVLLLIDTVSALHAAGTNTYSSREKGKMWFWGISTPTREIAKE